MLLNYDEGKINEAFGLLRGLDLSSLRYQECGPILKIAKDKKAWEFVVKVAEKLLAFEKEPRAILSLKLDEFSSYINLEKFGEAAVLGESLLVTPDLMALLDDANKESLLGRTVLARIRRGEFPEALSVLVEHLSLARSCEFRIGVEAETYIKNNDPRSALAAVVEGVKSLGAPSPEQYGRLFLVFTQIGNMMDLTLEPETEVVPGTFVKLRDQERWYFIGDGNGLDATPVPTDDQRYKLFDAKKIGDEVTFGSKYRSVHESHQIENILPIGVSPVI